MMLEVENLSYHRNGRPVFSDINFKVEPGNCLLLKGPNGSGKSTLLRVLAGLLPVQQGKLVINQNRTNDHYDFIAANIEFVGHLSAVKKQMTLWDNLQFWTDISGIGPLDRLEPKFNDPLSIDSFKNQLTFLCSEGQIRRLALSRLAISKKNIWLLDEPTTSLDRGTIQSFERLVKAHCLEGGIAVIATHDKLDIPKTQSVTINLKQIKKVEKTDFLDPFLAGEW